MTMVPCSRWPLAEHIAFGQNTFDVSIGSVVSFCIGTSCRWIPIFSSPPHFHRLVGLYRRSLYAGKKTVIERAYVLAERVGLPLWVEDDAVACANRSSPL